MLVSAGVIAGSMTATGTTATAAATPAQTPSEAEACDAGFLFGSGVVADRDVSLRTFVVNGPVAAGGNVTGLNAAVLGGTSRADRMVQAAGTVTGTGAVPSGSVTYGSGARPTRWWTPSGAVTQAAETPASVDIVRLFRSDIDSWATLPVTAATTTSRGTLTVKGTDPALNVADVTGPVTARAVTVDAPAGSTVLIRLTDVNVRWNTVTVRLRGGVTADRVMWLAPNATRVDLTAVTIAGSFVAPDATVVANTVAVTGTVAVKTFDARTGLVTGPRFEGCLPVPSTEPVTEIPAEPEPDPATAPPGPVSTVGVDNVVVTVDSNGGITPNSIGVDVTATSDDAAALIDDVVVSEAYDFTVPDAAPAFTSATITIPYNETAVAAVPTDTGTPVAETDVRIWHFDEEYGLWVPVEGGQTVDVEANTVTATVEHFSVYAVLALDARGFARYWNGVPRQCTASGGGIARDVVFVFNYEIGYEAGYPVVVASLKDLVRRLAESNPSNRVAVIDSGIGYDPTVATVTATGSTLLPFTALSSAEARDAALAALDQALTNTPIPTDATRYLSYDDALRAAADILAASPAGRPRNIVFATTLINSGFSDVYTLTDTMTSNGIRVDAVYVGSSELDELAYLLYGTGGTLLDPRFDNRDTFYARYTDGNVVVDPNVDTDGDGLTDCEEASGMLLNWGVYNDDITAEPWVYTNPNDPNSDADETGTIWWDPTEFPGAFPDFEIPANDDYVNDGLDDAAEMGRRFDLRDDGLLAEAYGYLIDAGVFYFWNPQSNPVDRDSDGDGVLDEVEINGYGPGFRYETNPLRWDTDGDWTSDRTEFVSGSDPTNVTEGDDLPDNLADRYPAYTLFQPAGLDGLAVPYRYVPEGDTHVLRSYSLRPVVWDPATGLCVSNCEPLRAEVDEIVGADGEVCVTQRGYFEVCFGRHAVEADLIDDARRAQGVFTSIDTFDRSFIGTQARAACFQYVDNAAKTCPGSGTFIDNAFVGGVTLISYGAAVTDTLIRTLPPESVSRSLKTQVRLFKATATGIESFIALSEADRLEVRIAIMNACQSEELDVLGTLKLVPTTTGPVHPCEFYDIFAPGSRGGSAITSKSTVESTRHVYDAIRSGRPLLLRYADEKADETPYSAQWYDRQPWVATSPCAGNFTTVTGLECDEYPYTSSLEMGPPQASLRLIDASDNSSAGAAYGQFTQRCPDVKSGATPQDRPQFLVVPMVGNNAPSTAWLCRDGR
jgi:choice-of-anchor A domain-containing protein